jgi:hypothetical protein
MQWPPGLRAAIDETLRIGKLNADFYGSPSEQQHGHAQQAMRGMAAT